MVASSFVWEGASVTVAATRRREGLQCNREAGFEDEAEPLKEHEIRIVLDRI